MNQHLQDILHFIQQAEHLTVEEKTALLKAAKAADKALEITTFQLESSEKVLEETTEELERKRKTVETQNRELEIEAALERVRSRAMAMHKSEELKDVANELRKQLASLGQKELETTAIHLYDESPDYFQSWAALLSPNTQGEVIQTNSQFPKHGVKIIEEMMECYNLNKKDYVLINEGAKAWEFIEMIRQYAPKVFEVVSTSLKGIAPENIKVYWSVADFKGGSLVMTTMIEPDGTSRTLLRRFANVFGLAYRRFVDLKLAEAQARESQIQLALERVRARTMAMQKPGEFGEVINAIGEQFVHLGFDVEWVNFGANGLDISKGIDIWNFAVIPGLYHSAERVFIPHFDHPVFALGIKGIEKYRNTGKDFYEILLDKKDKDNWLDHLFTKTIYKDVPDELRTIQYSKSGYVSSNIALKDSWLSIGKYDSRHFTDEQNAILKRFANAFGQAYTRFLDLQKAEAQVREAQIEASLERVRSRSMAMHKSDEVMDVAVTVYDELQKLDFKFGAATIIIMDKETGYMEHWLAGFIQKNHVESYPVNNIHHPLHAAQLTAWRKGEKFVSIELSGVVLKTYAQEMFTQTGYKNLPDDEKTMLSGNEQAVFNLAYMSHGALMWAPSALSDEKAIILQRFAKVFEQTYTRFLDLQKAEAQARESQIQLALERVRARTMAMQHSDELKDAAALLFQQAKALGVPAYSCGYNIWEKDDKVFTSWMSTQDGSDFNAVLNIPLTEDANFIRYVESKQKGEQFFVLELRDERMQEHYEYLKTIPAFKAYFDYALSVGFDLPETQIHYIANFSQGNLLFITLEPCPEFHDVFKRFAAVFDQTYTRFLDLQKAEAQAREAQIEAALERIRSRSLAMHTGSELGDVVTVIVEKLKDLGVVLDANGVVLCTYFRDSKNVLHWISSPDFSFAGSYLLPYFDHPIFNDAWQSKENGEDYFSKAYSVEEKNRFFEYAFEHSDYRHFPDEFKQWIFQNDQHILSFAWQKNSAILIPSHTGVLPSEDDIIILKRFAKVFEQAYARFLDLQKSEAQARESQIQLALERVRARTMAMQRSEELTDTAAVIFHQIKELGIDQWGSSFQLWEDDMKAVEAWTCTQGVEVKRFKIPTTEDPVMINIVNAAKKGEILYVEEMGGEVLEDHYKFMYSLPIFKEILDNLAAAGITPPKFQVMYAAYFSYGYILFIAHEPNPEAHDIFKRFAKVFEQTYTRFLDLQKSEAQARESQIQLALERVRARTMAMQKSDELMETAVVLFDQLKQLGEHIERTIIGVVNEEERIVDFWATRPHGSQMDKMQTFPLDEPIVMKKVYDAWQQQKKSIVIDLRGEELESYFQFLKGRSAKLKREIFGESRVENFAFFSKGFLGVISADPKIPANVELYERFAAVFEQTYTRFLDLQKAEEQAREAKIEAALEKVRSSSLAMHKTDELKDVINIVFEKLVELNIVKEKIASIFIYKVGSKDIDQWATAPDFFSSASHFLLPHFDQPINNEFWEAKEKGMDFFTKTISFEEKNKMFEWLFEHSDYKYLSDDTKKWLLESETFTRFDAFAKNSSIFIPSYTKQLLSENEVDTLKRFAKVFEQSYTRFLDLQKAEEQAREAQIQLALERVRARTMAMQRSDELPQAANLLFQQIQSLGMPAWSAGYCIWDDDKQAITLSMSSEGVLQPTLRMPLTEDPSLKHFRKAYESGESFFVEEVGGEELKEHYTYLRTLPGVKETLDDIEKAGFPVPTFQIFHLAYFTQGFLLFITYEQVPESHDIFKRFAKVFEQTYTRFLDLQKAEAQAKEAQIELGLERVRARTMAMQKSDELRESVRVIYEQLQHLGFDSNACNIIIIDKESGDMKYWVSGFTQEIFPEGYYVPYLSHPYHEELLAASRQNKKYDVMEYSGEMKKSFDDIFFTLTDFSKIPEEAKTFMKALESLKLSTAFFTYGALQVLGPAELPVERAKILERFAKVFDLTYTRFLDLQKAEGQARESQIQLVLERIRARTMAMQKSEELAETSLVLFQQFKDLGETSEQISIGIIKEDENIMELYSTLYGSQWKAAAKVDLDEPVVIKKIHTTWKKQKKSLVIDITGNDLKKYNAYRKKLSNLEYGEDRWVIHIAFFSKGVLTFSTTEPRPPETIQLLERFAGVFEQTYTRFLDLQKAEAQVREAQIEAALERVRSRTMAMQKSEDLDKAASDMFKQIQVLGMQPWACGFNIFDKNEKAVTQYMSVADGGISPPFRTPLTEDPFFINIYDARQRRDELLVMESGGESLAETYRYMFGLPGSGEIFGDLESSGFEMPKFQITHCAYFSQGYLVFITYEPVTESWDIFKRFAKVFEQTYTRFLDLQKSEAQARESQIQLALERVRARTMAMQHSNELMEAANLLFQQVESLGIPVWTCGYNIWETGEKSCTAWMSTHGAIQPSFRIPLTESPSFMHIYESRLKGQSFFIEEVSGEALADHYRYMFSLPDFNKIATEQLTDGFTLPASQVHNVFNFKHGNLIFVSAEQIPEAHDIFKRFAKVFEQTYTRFLDLQNAEAQAREAQIEAALERVRSRSMAMHKSDDLHEVIKVVTEQLSVLGLKFNVANFAKIDPDGSWNMWLSTPDQTYPALIHVPYLDNPIFNDVTEQVTKKNDFYTHVYTLEESNIFFHHFFENTIAKNSPEERKQFVYSSKGFTRSLFLTKNIWFSVSRYDTTPFTDEENEIFKRFSKVFEQTYTRFLDLQKAEAQAREAQIEAALERVRSRSMGMQKSEELKEVIQVVYEQFVYLNIKIEHTGFVIDYKARDDYNIWIADPLGVPSQVTIPYFDSVYYNRFNEAKKNGEDFFATNLDFEEKNKFYQKLFEYVPGLPEEAKKFYFSCPGLAASTVLLENVCLYIENFSGTPYTDEENKTLMRFGNVFQQTYTRFLDLQKAEAQAREAQIELGLERVRARAMAMQKSGELSELVDTVFKELTKLDFALTWCIINIIDESSLSNTVWAANPEIDKAPESYYMKFEDYPFHHAMMKDWKDRNTKSVYTLEGDEKRIYDDYLFSETEFKRTPEAAQAASRAMEKYVVSFSFSNFGGLQTVGDVPLSEANLDILSRFGKVFDLTYTRFNDLKQAEVQARESQIQLAMERVRARTMAMQRSAELAEVATVLFQQVKALGVPQWVCGFCIFEIDDKEFTWYPGGADGEILPPAKVPLTEHPVFISLNESRKRGDELLVYEKEGEFQADHYRYMMTVPDMREQMQRILDAGLSIPTFQIDHIANFAYGNLTFITYEHFPEMHDVFKRFAKVFEQTYTRFLDLQKAEAQAREAQIEAALERVRSRTMAMHKSDELLDVITVVADQLVQLNLKFDNVSFGENNQHDTFKFWLAAAGQPHPIQIEVPYLDNPAPKRVKGAQKKGLKFFADILTQKENQQWTQHLINYSDIKLLPDKVKNYLMDSVGYARSTFILKNINLYIGNYKAIPYTEEENNLFQRFAQVFEQSYTRFLDLKKAEAQAREAQIEAALERVRSRSLAMHKSDELQEVVHTVFEKLKELDVDLYTAIIFIFTEGSKDVVWWLANKANQQYARILVPYADNPYLKNIFDAKENRKDFFSATYSFEEKNKLFHHLFEHTDFKYVPETQKKFLLESELATMSVALAKNTGINITSYSRKSFSEEDNEILKRFAKVFDQAYTRFLDLQKAEAQAREAQIETALERVRSRSMGMQKSDELRDVIKVIYEQLIQLNFEISNAGFLMDYRESDDGNIWMTDASTEFPTKQHLPWFDHPFNDDYLEQKGKGPELFTKVYPFEQKNTWWEAVLKYLPGVSEETRKTILSLPALALSRVLMKHIGLYLLNYTGTPYSGAENVILMRFGKVFEQTYIRFNDLKNAEAQALEAIKRASVDRVRAEIASMRTTTDLERITPLIWNELTTLGVPFVRCGVFIMDEEKQLVEIHLSTPDGEAIATFNLPYSSPGETAQILEHWHKRELYKQHWNEAQFVEFTQNLVQQGVIPSDEKYLTQNHPTVLYLHFLPFLQGMLYAGNAAPLDDDALQLVQNLADAFSTAYARYKDFNKLEAAKKQVDSALNELQATQKQLIQSEKMASLGELTAGIAHEIQNPLNFVNNFSDVSNELLDEMQLELEKGNAAEAIAIVEDVKQNLQKILHHGKRADAIVKGMLQHSRSSSGVKEPTDINALCDEYLRLAYHGLRAKDKSFNAAMKTDFDNSIGNITIVPQDIGRAILNLITNAFYAVTEKKKQVKDYEPIISVSTKKIKEKLDSYGIEITVADNGNGISKTILDKIFQPFFTTKPAGGGTGLGLSLSYDIIKAHGGEIKVKTNEGEGSEFIIQLPIV